MSQLLKATERMAAGDLTARVPRGGPAEFGVLDTAFNRMAEGLQRRTGQIELAEKRYRGLFERNLAAMFRTTHDGRILECNAAFARTFGYASPDEVMQRRAQDLFVDVADRAAILHELAQGGIVTREHRMRDRDGTVRWMLVRATEQAGEATTFIEGMLLDVTDRRRAEEAERESAVLRNIAALAAAAAHEINNPLTVIRGHVELLAPEIRDSRRLAALQGAVDRVVDIVARMTRLTRVETRHVSPGLPPILDIRRSSETAAVPASDSPGAVT